MDLSIKDIKSSPDYTFSSIEVTVKPVLDQNCNTSIPVKHDSVELVPSKTEHSDASQPATLTADSLCKLESTMEGVIKTSASHQPLHLDALPGGAISPSSSQMQHTGNSSNSAEDTKLGSTVIPALESPISPSLLAPYKELSWREKDRRRRFREEWKHMWLVVPHGRFEVMCLVCQKIMTQRKLDTIKRHTVRRHVEVLALEESERCQLFDQLLAKHRANCPPSKDEGSCSEGVSGAGQTLDDTTADEDDVKEVKEEDDEEVFSGSTNRKRGWDGKLSGGSTQHHHSSGNSSNNSRQESPSMAKHPCPGNTPTESLSPPSGASFRPVLPSSHIHHHLHQLTPQQHLSSHPSLHPQTAPDYPFHPHFPPRSTASVSIVGASSPSVDSLLRLSATGLGPHLSDPLSASPWQQHPLSQTVVTPPTAPPSGHAPPSMEAAYNLIYQDLIRRHLHSQLHHFGATAAARSVPPSATLPTGGSSASTPHWRSAMLPQMFASNPLKDLECKASRDDPIEHSRPPQEPSHCLPALPFSDICRTGGNTSSGHHPFNGGNLDLKPASIRPTSNSSSHDELDVCGDDDLRPSSHLNGDHPSLLHQLQSSPSGPLICRVLRLSPGQEVVTTLCAAVSKFRLRDAFVVSCCGSLARAKLQVAGKSRSPVGPLDLISLSGHISTSPATSRLSASLIDAEGRLNVGRVSADLHVAETVQLVLGSVLHGTPTSDDLLHNGGINTSRLKRAEKMVLNVK